MVGKISWQFIVQYFPSSDNEFSVQDGLLCFSYSLQLNVEDQVQKRELNVQKDLVDKGIVVSEEKSSPMQSTEGIPR